MSLLCQRFINYNHILWLLVIQDERRGGQTDRILQPSCRVTVRGRVIWLRVARPPDTRTHTATRFLHHHTQLK